MTLTLTDLQHLEVMARLKNQPKSTSASIQFPSELVAQITHSPTLTEKLMTLASKLRQQVGFESYAQSLETHWALYKTALTQNDLLYRAHTETGEDLIEFAHPEGDVEMAPAKDHQGDVETQLSQHRKILEVVNQKMPRKVAQTVPIDPSKDLIDPSTVGNKFGYMANYLQQNILNVVPADINTLPKAEQDYFLSASRYYEFAEQVQRNLNFTGPTPASQVIATINKLFNNNTIDNEITSLEQIQPLIENVLNWFEDHKPVKKTALLKMVKEVLNIKTSQIVETLIPSIIELWTHTRRLNDGIKNNAEILSNELNTILQEDEIKKNAQTIKLINRLQSALDQSLPQWFESFDQAQSPGAVKQKIILGYSKFLKNLAKLMGQVNLEMKRIRRTTESGIFESVHRALIASPFEDVQKAIQGLYLAIKDQLNIINEFKAQSETQETGEQELAPPSESGQDDLAAPSQDKSQPRTAITVSTTKEKELQRLNAWKDKITNSSKSDKNKQLANTWLDAQIQAVNNLAEDNLDGLKQILTQNNQFQTDWKL